MAITILPPSLQEPGQFNGGAILEKRPVIPGKSEATEPYSNLFYWANAWSDAGSTIGEHPHRGFEIMSFVIKGQIEHYDTKYREWKPLKAGDAQIIRSGNGISHAEKMGPGSQMFQIWLDPNLDQTLSNPASYDDYASETIPSITDESGIRTRYYAGPKGAMNLNTEGVEIREITFPEGSHTWKLDSSQIYSVYLLEGMGQLDGQAVQKDDFAKITDSGELQVTSESGIKVFVIASPKRPSYPTYVERFNVSFG